MKKYYFQYVNHCLTYYFRYHISPQHRSESDSLNWKACDEAMSEFSDKDRALFRIIYTGNDTLPNSISKISIEHGIDANSLWGVMNKLALTVAEKRGLV